MLIYKATNLIHGKIYIGMTTKTLDHPIKVHKRDSQRLNTYFYRAIRKHGFDKFRIDTAETMEQLEEKERYDIKLYNCFDNKDVGYNIQSGSNSLYEIIEEHRRQISERINHNCVGRTKKAGSFRWKYVKDERYANIVPSLGFLP